MAQNMRDEIWQTISKQRAARAAEKRAADRAYQKEWRKQFHTVAVMVPHELYAKLEAECEKLGVSNSFYIVTLLANTLDESK